jgi:hypothetical protein
MPILDDIRRNQIAEAMNYDRTMYMKAFQLTKRAVNVMDPEPAPENEPYVQVNPEDTQAAEELVNNLLLLLEQKRNAIDSLTRGQGTADSISIVEDVLTSYNTLVNLLINPKATPQTRSALLTSVLKIEKYVVGYRGALREGAQRSPETTSESTSNNLLLHEGAQSI